jgi:hypothetical protein
MSALSFLKKSKVTKKKADDKVEKLFEKMSIKEKDVTENIEGLFDKMSINESKGDVPSDVPKDVRFRHSIYGTFIRGQYKGYDIEIRQYYPSMYEVLLDNKIVFLNKSDIKFVGRNNVKIRTGPFKNKTGSFLGKRVGRLGILLDSKYIIIHPNDILYKDVLLKSRQYAQVNRVVQINKEYTFSCVLIDNTQIKVTMSDIESFMPGFSLNKEIPYEVRDEDIFVSEREIEDDQYSEVLDESDIEDDEDRYSEVLHETEPEEREEPELFDEQPETRQQRSYKDIDRVYWETNMTPEQKKYMRLIDEVLRKAEISTDLTKYTLVDDIIEVVYYMKNKISSLKINFDIEKSVDLKFIIAVVVLIHVIKSGFPINIDTFISKLLDKKFIGNIDSSIVFTKDRELLLQCNVENANINLIIKGIMICYNKVIQDILYLYVNIETVSDYQIEYIKPQKINKEVKNFLTINEIKRGNVDYTGIQTIVWGPYYRERLDSWLRNFGDREDVYIVNNMERAPIILNENWESIIDILYKKSGFTEKYNRCSDNLCRNKVVNEYIERYSEGEDQESITLKRFGKLISIFTDLIRD